jgi:hypothetical protein
VLPEHARQLERMGIDQKGSPVDVSKKKAAKPEVLTPEKEKEIRAEIALQKKWLLEDKASDSQEPEYIPEVVNEAAELRYELGKMNEMDRYEKITEFEIRGVMIPEEYQLFTTYFERTSEYENNREYFEEFRAKMAIAYQVDMKNRGLKIGADAGTSAH